MVIFDQLPKLYLGLDEQPEITILAIVGLLEKNCPFLFFNLCVSFDMELHKWVDIDIRY